jgi:hypothetical protein
MGMWPLEESNRGSIIHQRSHMALCGRRPRASFDDGNSDHRCDVEIHARSSIHPPSRRWSQPANHPHGKGKQASTHPRELRRLTARRHEMRTYTSCLESLTYPKRDSVPKSSHPISMHGSQKPFYQPKQRAPPLSTPARPLIATMGSLEESSHIPLE